MAESAVAKKLRIKPGNKVLILNAPDDYAEKLGELPEDVTVSKKAGDEFDVVIAFYTQKSVLDEQVDLLKFAMGDKGLLWICYPKGTSKVPADINRDIIWKHLENYSLTGVAMVAIDETWSAMRLKKI